MHLTQFTFNPFQENTYIVYDDTQEAIIIDPGMMDEDEDAQLFEYIAEKNLKPAMVVNTHCHLDHILGNASACARFSIPLLAHRLELPMLDRASSASLMWNVPYRLSPAPSRFLDEGDEVTFGHTRFRLLLVPGHAPGHIALVCDDEKLVIAGDVLFRESVGRVDLPMCNAQDLVYSIQQKMYALPDDYTVHSGHGPETTIGHEKEHNAFVRIDWQCLI
ncbi:MAG: MBL fold metallo-hydrolase [Flavobacteriales bacterium]